MMILYFISFHPFHAFFLKKSRSWIIYWILHGLYLLDEEPVELYSRIILQLKQMQNLTGGFGGGPSQISHW